MRYRIYHRTEYRYSAPVTTSHTVAHLRPRTTQWQSVISDAVNVEPWPLWFDEHSDAFGNRTTHWSIAEPHDHLVVNAYCDVEVTDQTVPATSPAWELVPELMRGDPGDEALMARWFALPTELTCPTAELSALARQCFPPGCPMHEAVATLSATLHRELIFDPTATDVSTPAAAVLAQGRGVCQDFAHLTIAVLRSLGLPARYVSGYLETEPPPGEPRLVGADASHAWCSVWVPGFGWLDVDPTNDQMPPTRHVTVAWGRDFTDVVPVRGVVFGPPARQELYVSVDVQQVAP